MSYTENRQAAENLLDSFNDLDWDDQQDAMARAQVYATLALAAAVAEHQPERTL